MPTSEERLIDPASIAAAEAADAAAQRAAPRGSGRDRLRERDTTRADRADDDRAVSENGELSDEEALSLLETQWLSTRLPDPPSKPGFHRIWLSSTNQYTPIAFFERLGYRPVRPSDWPGHDALNLKSGQVSPNQINVNEMVLYEISEAKYQLYMRHMHHRVPLREEDKIRAIINDLRGRLGNRGRNVSYDTGEGENGFAELEDRPIPRNPQFQ
jgi:hypothetical protein